MKPVYKNFTQKDAENFQEEGKKRYEKASTEQKLAIQFEQGTLDKGLSNFKAWEEALKSERPLCFLSVATDGMDKGNYKNHMPMEVALSYASFDKKEHAFEIIPSRWYVNIPEKTLEANITHNGKFDVFAYNGITREGYNEAVKYNPAVVKENFEKIVHSFPEKPIFVACNVKFSEDYLRKLDISLDDYETIDLLNVMEEYDYLNVSNENSLLNAKGSRYNLTNIYDQLEPDNDFSKGSTADEKCGMMARINREIYDRELKEEMVRYYAQEERMKEDIKRDIKRDIEHATEQIFETADDMDFRELFSSKRNDSLDVYAVDGNVKKVGEMPLRYAGDFKEEEIKKDVEEGKYTFEDVVATIQECHNKEMELLSKIWAEISKVSERVSDLEQKTPNETQEKTAVFEENDKEEEEEIEK